MSTPDDQNTVLGPPTDVTVSPEDVQDEGGGTPDAEATPAADEDAEATDGLGGTEGTGGAG